MPQVTAVFGCSRHNSVQVLACGDEQAAVLAFVRAATMMEKWKRAEPDIPAMTTTQPGIIARADWVEALAGLARLAGQRRTQQARARAPAQPGS